MPKAALDTSVVVAALQAWHQDHRAALACLQGLFAADEEIVLATRVLVEAFSVMTRMPAPYRLKPEAAKTLLCKTFEGKVTMSQIPDAEYWSFLRQLGDRGISGGTVYDAEILECSRRAGTKRLYTFNTKHFDRLSPGDMEIIDPNSLP